MLLPCGFFVLPHAASHVMSRLLSQFGEVASVAAPAKRVGGWRRGYAGTMTGRKKRFDLVQNDQSYTITMVVKKFP